MHKILIRGGVSPLERQDYQDIIYRDIYELKKQNIELKKQNEELIARNKRLKSVLNSRSVRYPFKVRNLLVSRDKRVDLDDL